MSWTNKNHSPSEHVWLVIRGEKGSNKINLIREMVESLFKAGVSETNELFMSARDDYEAGDLDEAIKKFYDLMQREGLQEDAAQAIEFAEILAKQRYGDTGQVVRAANNMEFTVNAQAKVTVGIADIEKRPEVERLRATDLPVERKAERARQFAPQMLKEIVADKLRGINEYASSQGIVMINAGSPEPEDGNIDWVDYFRRFERSKPGATKPKEGGINEPEEVV